MHLSDPTHRAWMRGLHALASVLLRTAYRLRVEGESNLPREGGVLVVANHTAFHDFLFVGVALSRPVRFVMHEHHFRYAPLRAFFEASRVIPIAPAKQSPLRLAAAMDAIDDALARGEVVVIFPEGRMSDDGRMNELRPGLERIVARRPVPVVPVAVSGLFGSWMSRAHGEPMSGRPRRFRARVTVRIGRPLPASAVSVPAVRRGLEAVLEP